MAHPFSPNNPGIGGLDELTSAEEIIVASIASLGTAGQVLTVNSGATGVEWSDSAGGSTISVDGSTVSDPDFISTGDVDFIATGSDVTGDVIGLRGVTLDSTVGSPSDGDILVYRSAGTDWVLEAKPAGGSNPALSDITDVTLTSVADNEVLAFDSGSGDWINQTAAEAGLAAASHTHTLSDVTDSGALAALNTVDTAQIDDEAITEAKLDALDAPSDGEVLSYDNGTGRLEWVAQSGGASSLDDLSDVTITTVSTGDFLRYNGSNFVNTTIASGDLPSHTHTLSDITDSGTAAAEDTGTTSGTIALLTTGGVFADARISQSSVTQHQAALSITESQISDLGSYITASSTDTLTNKTIDGDNNTISNLDIGNEVDWAAATDVADRSATPDTGDKLLLFEAGVGLRKIDWDDLPSGSGNVQVDQSGGTSDSYGVLSGTINGTNTTFTVSESEYISGTLKVWLNGQLLTQGSSEDWTETTPGSGTFDFAVAPESGDEITVEYGAATVAGSGTMDDFTVAGDSGTPQTIADGNTLTVAGGTGVDTSAGATDTVTIALDSATQTSLGLADTATQPGDNISTLTNDSGYITATLTDEEVQDIVGGMVTGNTETLITVTYEDTDGTLDFVVEDDLSLYDNTTSGFITDYTVTEADVTQHEAALTITESQISDLSHVVDVVSNVATSTILGRVTAGSGDSEELTATQVRTLINVEDGATADQTDEEIQDAAWNVLGGTQTLITVTYQDATNNVDFVVDNDLSNYDNSTSGFITGITGEPIADLSDVTITTPADNEVLAYDNGTSTWINQTAAEAGLAAASHTHTLSDITDSGTAAAEDTGTTSGTIALLTTGGVFADARISESSVTQHETALTITESQISDLGSYITASSTDTLTNKTIDGDSNTLSNLDIGNEVDWAAATDVTDAGAFASGDKLLIFEAGVGLRKVDFDDLPSGGGASSLDGLSDVGIVSVSGAQILVYDGTTDNQFENVSVSGDATLAEDGTLSLESDAVDAITEIASGLKTGVDTTLVTGTAGLTGNLTEWNGDGDLVASDFSASDFLESTTPFVKAITIEDPTSSEDITMFFTDIAITVTQMNAVLLGSSTPSVTWTIRHNSDRSATGAEVVTSGTTTTSTTTGSEVTSFNDATIPAGSWVWFETSASSGTVDEINVTIEYTID